MNTRLFTFLFFLVVLSPVFLQEVIGSPEENYYEFLSLDGTVAKEFLNYRTLSDSVWAPATRSLQHAVTDEISYRIYGPATNVSWNSSAPYGGNDGALWQGKGFNAQLNTGLRLEAYGIELTFKPELYSSQNLGFDLVAPAYSGELYADKAEKWGYYGIRSIDAPQRFGNDALYGFSWGDSEIRYSYKSLTIGFGTQAIWLGPAKINPLMHSNNAPPYPKLDVGIRRQPVHIRGWYLGDVEFRAWWGKTTESDYFDTIDDNDHNLMTGLSVSWAPPVVRGLTLGFHRTMLSDWDAMDYDAILTLLWPFMDSTAGRDERDQRASLTASYALDSVDLELYLEWGRNDYSPDLDFILRYPFHTQAYTVGGQKGFTLPFLRGVKNRLIIEITNLESSRDYELLWPTTFYAHHQIVQGYTNEGQWIGAPIGTGGNSQYIAIESLYRKGITRVFFQRVNPDNDYIWFMDTIDETTDPRENEKKIRVDLSFGVSGLYWLSEKLSLSYTAVVTDSMNYQYGSNNSSIHRFNIHLATGFTFAL